MRYTAKQASKLLNLEGKTISKRAVRLGMKKNGTLWNFSLEDIELINNLKYERSPDFKFSDEGDFLIIPSKINYKTFKI